MGPEFRGPDWELFANPPESKEPNDAAGTPTTSTQG